MRTSAVPWRPLPRARSARRRALLDMPPGASAHELAQAVRAEAQAPGEPAAPRARSAAAGRCRRSGPDEGMRLGQAIDQAQRPPPARRSRSGRRTGARRPPSAASPRRLAHPADEALAGCRPGARFSSSTSSGLLGAERVEQSLVLAGRVDAALDAEPGDRVVEAEAGADHADRAHDRGRRRRRSRPRHRRASSRPRPPRPRRRRAPAASSRPPGPARAGR